MSERGSEGINFNEKLMESFGLAEKFRKSGALGKKTDQESINVANEKVREILSTSFPVAPHAETQRDLISQYTTVAEMVEISKNNALLQPVKDQARDALFQIGLALSQDKEIFKAATEGTEELNKILVPGLHEIQPYILSVFLTKGKDDVEGQEIVGELVNLFKIKKKATERPDYYENDFKEASKKLFNKLFDKRDELDAEAVTDGTEGRIETMIGYIYAIDEKKEENKGAGLGKVTEGMEAAAEKIKNSVEKFVINYDELGKNGLSEKEIAGLEIGDEDRKLIDNLKKNTTNSALSTALDYLTAGKQMREFAKRTQDRSGFPEDDMAGLKEMILFIEKGSSNVDDLSRNSHKYQVLYQVQNGEFDDRLIGTEYEGKKLDKNDIEVFKEEIGQRMLLQNFELAASKCKTIEDIVRMLTNTHEGDTGDLDKKFAYFFLKKGGCGVDKLPVDIAWNYRQQGYFRIEEIKKGLESQILSDDKEFLDYLMKNDETSGFKNGLSEAAKEAKEMRNEVGDLSENEKLWELLNYLEIDDKDKFKNELKEAAEEAEEVRGGGSDPSLAENFWDGIKNDKSYSKEFKDRAKKAAKEAEEKRKNLSEVEKLWNYIKEINLKDINIVKLDPEIKKNEMYGISRNYYKNFLMKEKSDSSESKVIKEYMIWSMKKARNITRDKAEKAFELAKKFSRATFSDSKANLAFTGDDYSELLNAKLLRFTDGPNHGIDKPGKSKAVGHAETIATINALCAHWMDLNRNEFSMKKDGTRDTNSPLYTYEIDFNTMTKYNMQYHFSAVVYSQVLPFQEALYNNVGPKDVTGLTYLNKLFAKINKTTYDMCTAGIESVYYIDKNTKNKVYGEGKEVREGVSQNRVAELMRTAWMLNLFYLIGVNNSGWTSANVENLLKQLRSNELIYDKEGRIGGSFVPSEYIRMAIERTNLISRTTDNDAEEAQRRKRTTF